MFLDEDSEVFQVKKSSHSKKIIKKLDKERKKKTHHNSASSLATDRVDKESNFNNNFNSNSDNSVKKENTDKKSHLIQKEIRTGDLVVRLLLFNFLTIQSILFKIIFYSLLAIQIGLYWFSCNQAFRLTDCRTCILGEILISENFSNSLIIPKIFKFIQNFINRFRSI